MLACTLDSVLKNEAITKDQVITTTMLIVDHLKKLMAWVRKYALNNPAVGVNFAVGQLLSLLFLLSADLLSLLLVADYLGFCCNTGTESSVCHASKLHPNRVVL